MENEQTIDPQQYHAWFEVANMIGLEFQLPSLSRPVGQPWIEEVDIVLESIPSN